MNTQQAYDHWSSQYDTNLNKTRDLEAFALKEVISGIPFTTCLEIGCGTGKNTQTLLERATSITAVDLSSEMLAKAKEKINSDTVSFIQADILENWNFATSSYDLITFSLMLEHIEDLSPVFEKAAAVLVPGGHIYVGELHPFKQYAGSKARFETAEGVQVVDCYTHHISEFVNAAEKNGFTLSVFREYFDKETENEIPRLLVLVFKKK